MSADMAADIVQQLEEPARTELMQGLDAATRATIEGLLAYPENTAGAMMTTEFVSVPATWTVEQTLQHIRQVERTRETVYAIYVLDAFTRRLVGAVSLRRLIAGEPSDNIADLARLADHHLAADRPRRRGAADLAARSAGGAGGRQGRACARHRHRRRHHRRHHRGKYRGRAEVRRHGGDRRALHADRACSA